MLEKCPYCDSRRADGRKTCGRMECQSKLLRDAKAKHESVDGPNAAEADEILGKHHYMGQKGTG